MARFCGPHMKGNMKTIKFNNKLNEVLETHYINEFQNPEVPDDFVRVISRNEEGRKIEKFFEFSETAFRRFKNNEEMSMHPPRTWRID